MRDGRENDKDKGNNNCFKSSELDAIVKTLSRKSTPICFPSKRLFFVPKHTKVSHISAARLALHNRGLALA